MDRLKKQFSVFCSLLLGVFLFLGPPRGLFGEQPTTAATNAFNLYSRAVATRMAQQHRSQNNFIVLSPGDEARLQRGEILITKVNEPNGGATAGEEIHGALLHHWRGTAFVPGGHVAAFEHLLRNFNNYPKYFSPEVLQARVISANGNQLKAFMRLHQKHIITVVMDTTYDVNFGELDRQHGYSISQSTHINEIGAPGTSNEHALSPDDEHGFLWRLNTYWSYEERDGGLYLQFEAVSLTRAVPGGLGWLIGPYVQSIPRESLEFTLHSAYAALGGNKTASLKSSG